jgi:glycosyltransferase involved in cell wall biosynthesis
MTEQRKSRAGVRSLSMVLPAYNEEVNIARAVERADAALAATGLDCELIVVNDGSRDRTGEILRRLVPRYPRLRVVEHFPNRGYGGALRAGFAAAEKDWVFQSDSDNQFDYGELSRLIALAPGQDFVVGYRRPRRDPLLRRFNGWGWNLLIRLFFGYVVRDIDCAFRLIRRSALQRVLLSSDGAMISTELLAGAKARDLTIAETPVTHLPRDGGHPTGANLTVILRAFRDLVRYRVELSRQLRDERVSAAPRGGMAPPGTRGLP